MGFGSKWLLSLLVLLFSLSCSPKSSAAVERIDPRVLKARWEAAWISCPDRDRTSYGVFHFRREFELKSRPAEFIVHVSADNRYKLYANGTEVSDGPARGNLDHWRFETVDLSSHLKPGKNVLAAVVWNFGEYIPWAQITNETAFVVQGNTEREAVVNTDKNWKVSENMAYSPIALDRSRVNAFCVVGPGDRLDGRLYPWGWEQAGFDDSGWKTPVRVSPATPREIRDGDSDWNLVPRMIPQMEKKAQVLGLVRRCEGVEAGPDFISGKKDLAIPPQSRATILFDQSHLTTAYPLLTVNGGAGAKITLTYAEALFDSQGRKAHRDSVAGMKILGYSDEFLPDGGRNRLFGTLWFRTFRYLEMRVETADQALTIHSLQSRYVGYPFREEASFESDDRSLDRIWEVCWRTARLCAGETYFDCPYYEQLQYVGDTRIQALISLYVTGDNRLMRKAICQFDDSRIPDGLTASRYPSSTPQIIPPYSLFWVAMLHDWWMHCPDREFAGSYLLGVRGVLEWFEKHLTPNNLCGNLPWWNFVDWAPEYKNGVPPGAESGESAVVSLQFVYALRMAEDLARAFGRTGEADYYRGLAAKVSEAVKRLCWSPERGLFAETPEKKEFSQHTNAMALLVDLVDQKEQAGLFEKIVSDPDLIQCTFYYRYYLLRAMKKIGQGGRYLEMLGPWRKMLDLGLTTFAEEPEPTRSDCHAWSASPMYELLATVCGIEPSAPGFRKVRIAPNPGRLRRVKAVLPHWSGKIRCSLEREGDTGLIAEIELPPGLEGVLVWNGKETPLRSGKQTIQAK